MLANPVPAQGALRSVPQAAGRGARAMPGQATCGGSWLGPSLREHTLGFSSRPTLASCAHVGQRQPVSDTITATGTWPLG